MNFYVVLGQGRHPLFNRLFTESEIEKLKKQPNTEKWLFVPIEVPWRDVVHSSPRGGYGRSNYKNKEDLTTINLPRQIKDEVKRFAIWLDSELNVEE